MKKGIFSKKRKNGITLIALVVTIVILLILSGVTINMLLGENGIIRTAQEAKNTWEGAIANEQEEIQNLVNELNNIMNEEEGSGGEEPGPDPEPEEPVDITTITDIVQKEEGEKAKDSYGNVVVVPKGFKVVVSEGTTVPEGIVIEDVKGNQFVWIPVRTVYKNAEKTESSTIKLGRYTFNTSNGTPTMQQAAFAGDNESNPGQTYESDPPVTIESNFQELTTYRAGTPSNGLDGLNAAAKNLAGFMQSVQKNGGYYIARYEASYGEGYNSEAITDVEKYANAKPLSIVSTGTPRGRGQGSTPLKQGTLWNYVTQLNASKICQNMYENDNTVGVESDLTNSYAYDTAIVFIEKMDASKSNYANANCDTTGNTSLMNTGMTGDKACNIYDMAANIMEWTTEYSTYIYNNTNAWPCTSRGGKFDANGHYTSMRYYTLFATYTDYFIGFRPILYIK